MFGAWRLCSDGNHHYMLAGSTLCERPLKDWGEPIHKPGNPNHDCDRRCDRCFQLNFRRWAGKNTVDAPAPA